MAGVIDIYMVDVCVMDIDFLCPGYLAGCLFVQWFLLDAVDWHLLSWIPVGWWSVSKISTCWLASLIFTDYLLVLLKIRMLDGVLDSVFAWLVDGLYHGYLKVWLVFWIFGWSLICLLVDGWCSGHLAGRWLVSWILFSCWLVSWIPFGWQMVSLISGWLLLGVLTFCLDNNCVCIGRVPDPTSFFLPTSFCT